MIRRALVLLAIGVTTGLVHGWIEPVRLEIEAPEGALGPPAEYTARGAPFITLETTHRRFLEHAAFVDARVEDEFAEGHIPGAVHLPVDAFRFGYPERLAEVPSVGDVVVYCGNADCNAALLVGKRLREFGYQTVWIFEAGLEAWVAAGHETSSP